MRRRVLPCTTFALLLVAVAVSLTAGPAAAAKSPPVMPALHLPGRTGQVDSDSLHARVLLVDFWASWCVPCRRSFPWLAHMDSVYAGRGLAIVAVNLDKERGPAEDFLARYPAPFRVAFDPQGETAETWHVKGMPTTYLVRADGTVLKTHAGFDDHAAREFEELITKELAP